MQTNSPEDFDVIVVGARAAGSSLAINLARAGYRVALLDRATFPSDTMSTHVIYPNTLARLDKLGVLDRIMAHRPPPLYTSWYHEGRMWVAPHTPVDGRDFALCVRRITLDGILVEQARAAGATLFEGCTVTALHGTGTEKDSVRGVIATRAAEKFDLYAPLVIGADGVGSTVARIVGAVKTKIMPSDTMLFYAYWTGAKTRNTQDFFFEPPWVCAHFPADDDHHVVTMNGPTSLKKDINDLEEFYLRRIRSIPALWNRLEGATKVSRVNGSARLEGFYRKHTGAGWALSGDAAHFKHPATAQGIGDALQAAEQLTAGILAGNWMTAYPAWRESESREMYAFSKHLAEPPGDAGMRVVMNTLIHDAALARRMTDVWARTARPWTDVIPKIPGMNAITGASIDEVLASVEHSHAVGAAVDA